MSERSSRRVARLLLALFGGFMVLVPVFYALNHAFERALEGDVVTLIASAGFAGAGYMIAIHHRDNAIGWIFLVAGVSTPLTALTEQYGIYSLNTNPGSLPAAAAVAWISTWAWVLAVMLPVFYLPLLFPDGRLPSRRWLPIAAVDAIVIVAYIMATALSPKPLTSFGSVANPFGIESFGTIAQSTKDILEMIAPVVLVASVIAVIVRFHASHGVERQQMKWFTYAVAVMGILSMLNDTVDGSNNLLFGVGITLLPVATGIAIVRYRLYDIDRIINKTLVYGVLTAILATLDVVLVIGLEHLLNPIASGSDLIVAGSTLAVAALVRPLRSRIQTVVDRRFYRRKYDATRTLEAFSSRLRDQTDLSALASELGAVVQETMQPTQVSLWLCGGRGGTGRQSERKVAL
jgi:hypothetical protein